MAYGSRLTPVSRPSYLRGETVAINLAQVS